jgi:hypothetical protein
MMQSRTKLLMGMAVFTATLMGLSHTASAKTVWAMATDQNPNTPDGTTYSGCGSGTYWAQASGFYADGSLACLARSFANGAYVTGPCLSGASTFQSTIRSVGSTYCSGARNAWSGTISACHVLLFGKTSASSSCGTFDLGIWGRGN